MGSKLFKFWTLCFAILILVGCGNKKTTDEEEQVDKKDAQKFVTKVSGDGTNVGDEVAIGDEHFYVIKNDGNEITMLSKYNLLVGKECTKGSVCSDLENPTGIQDETAKGYDGDQTIGTLPFSSKDNWVNKDEDIDGYSDSSIKSYVDEYEAYLENLGAEIIDSRLIKKSELASLGCDFTNETCENAPEWVYSTAYWTGTIRSTKFYSNVWAINSDNSIGGNMYNYPGGYGVRPVIVVSVDSIK